MKQDAYTVAKESDGFVVQTKDGAFVALFRNEADAVLFSNTPHLVNVAVGTLECLDAGDTWNKRARRYGAQSLRMALTLMGVPVPEGPRHAD